MKPSKPIDSLILTLRGQKVILDTDLAALYGVETRALNQAIKRNLERFPEEFCFQLTRRELASFRPESSLNKSQDTHNQRDVSLKSQSVISSLDAFHYQHFTKQSGGRRTPPYGFTEHGALMAANVLSSNEAVQMSVYIVRAFIKQRELLLAQTDVLKRLAQIDAKLLKHDDALRVIWRELQPLLSPPPVPAKPSIGFHAK